MPVDAPKAGAGKGLDLFKNKWVLYGGIGVLVLGVGYIALSNQQPASAPQGQIVGDPTQFGAGTPASGGIDSSNTDDSALAAAISAQAAAQAGMNQVNLLNIQDSLTAALAADQTVLSGSQIAASVSQYAASTNVLDQFLAAAGKGVISLGGWVDPTASGGVSVGLFSANDGSPNDYTDILHQIAAGGPPPQPAPTPVTLPSPPPPPASPPPPPPSS